MSGNRYEKAKEKHLSDLDVSVIDQLAYCDPSKDHKYLDWMMLQTDTPDDYVCFPVTISRYEMFLINDNIVFI